eukprot:Amastigsp_a528971_3.p3 type:complete len:178 gc:universal Amastigsp_a528971_3:244-777(+)
MFHPSAPNLRRSCTIPWKKHSEKSSLRKTAGDLACSRYDSSMERYERRRFERSPRGGSCVILIDSWRTSTGNAADGIEVSQSLKSRWSLTGSHVATMRSSSGSHDVARWQFSRSTQVPRSMASLIIVSARSPWPRPSEIDASFLPNRISTANLYRSEPGSAPGERTKMSGVAALESR